MAGVMPAQLEHAHLLAISTCAGLFSNTCARVGNLPVLYELACAEKGGWQYLKCVLRVRSKESSGQVIRPGSPEAWPQGPGPPGGEGEREN